MSKDLQSILQSIRLHRSSIANAHSVSVLGFSDGEAGQLPQLVLAKCDDCGFTKDLSLTPIKLIIVKLPTNNSSPKLQLFSVLQLFHHLINIANIQFTQQCQSFSTTISISQPHRMANQSTTSILSRYTPLSAP